MPCRGFISLARTEFEAFKEAVARAFVPYKFALSGVVVVMVHGKSELSAKNRL